MLSSRKYFILCKYICLVALEWYKGLVQLLRQKDTMNEIMQRFFLCAGYSKEVVC